MPAPAPIEILRGSDSAGATIELEKRDGALTLARAADAVLGAAEAEVIATAPGAIEFEFRFPAGATITYVGTLEPLGGPSIQAARGTWTQHAGGIFGDDTGTWEAAVDTSLAADR